MITPIAACLNSSLALTKMCFSTCRVLPPFSGVRWRGVLVARLVESALDEAFFAPHYRQESGLSGGIGES